jgi:DNA-binding MarR family transcriptional regulator
MPDRRSRPVMAAEAWRHVFDFVVATVGQRERVLNRLGLSPGDGRALSTLSAREGRTMRSLADDWECDASTATWIVDRLERRGLTERRPSPEDRRVKLVALTKKGVRTKNKLTEGLYSPPEQLLDMTRADLRALRDAAAKLPRGGRLLPPPGIESR